jgi:hypothetical protein
MVAENNPQNDRKPHAQTVETINKCESKARQIEK